VSVGGLSRRAGELTVDDGDSDNGFRPNADDPSQPLATSLKPLTAATLTVRIVKSFEFRTAKALILKDVDLTRVTVGQLMDMCREGESVLRTPAADLGLQGDE